MSSLVKQTSLAPLDPKTKIMDSSNSWEEPWEAIPEYAAAMTSLPQDSSHDLLQPATGSGLEHVDLAGYGAQSTLGAASSVPASRAPAAPATGDFGAGGRASTGVDNIGMEDLEILDFAAAKTPAKPLVFELQTTTTDSPTNDENDE